MTIATGTRVGPYEIAAQIGAGGMGEVYRARDARLSRDVALKVLPDAFALDADRLARFKREAQVLASLNHPNIAAIYGFEDSGSVQALVLELVEGETLEERIRRPEGLRLPGDGGGRPSGLPIDEALRIAHQVAQAIEAAHEHGVVHRDLKPSNIKVSADSVVKVLDFGLAKALGPADAGPYVHQDHAVGAGFSRPDMTASPTITSPAMMTREGVILGTAAYMAPEQAKGRPADKRADVWAFGCVLYEMLTGRAPFAGEDVSDTLANVLKREPDWNLLPAETPAAIRALLKRCLEKDRRRRAGDIAAALFAIDEAATLGATGIPTALIIRSSMMRRAALPLAALAMGGALAAAGVVYFRAAPAEAPEMRLHITTPPVGEGIDAVSFAVSPDGQSIVFRAAAGQTSQLWLRMLDSETARPLSGTENGFYPFWSPDGRSIGFFADQSLKRTDVAGGNVQTLATAPSVFGATWSPDDTIVFSGANMAPLYRVPATGGERAVEVTRLQPGQASHRLPQFLPDGRRFLFFATGAPEVQGVFVGSLNSTDAKRLVDAGTRAEFVPPDRILFARGEALYAQRMDLESMTLLGDPLLVAERVAQTSTIFGSVAVSASASGMLAYRAAAETSRDLAWVDRQNRETGTLGPVSGLVGTPRVSPDGRTLAVMRRVNGNDDIWLIETARGVLRRFTFDAAIEAAPVWSPNGNRIAFESARKGLRDLFVKSLDASAEEVLVESSENKNISDWSADGRFIAFAIQSSKTARDIWVLPLEGDREPFAVVQTAFEERDARFSPDGGWIAYQSNETGRNEVFVQPFPGPGRNWQISTDGGTFAQWRGDGREIFYLARDNRLMAVPVKLDASAPAVDAGTPVALFPLRPGAAYAVTPDGQRFLVNTPTDDATASPITVILNWKPSAR
jgi:Tol biopolymer transport system component